MLKKSVTYEISQEQLNKLTPDQRLVLDALAKLQRGTNDMANHQMNKSTSDASKSSGNQQESGTQSTPKCVDISQETENRPNTTEALQDRQTTGKNKSS